MNGRDMGVVDIPDISLKETLKVNPTWQYVGEIKIGVKEPEPVMWHKGIGTKCPICGFEAKNEYGLRRHKEMLHM